MKGWNGTRWAMIGALASVSALANARLDRVLLIPLDDRPATGQFAQMIGDIAEVQVDMPPPDLLGRFTQPGRPDALLDWLNGQSMADYDAVILSTDMVLYGGLIASRSGDVTLEQARERLRKLIEWRGLNPKMPVYAFSSLMRIAPTSRRDNVRSRELIRRASVLRARVAEEYDFASWVSTIALLSRIPREELQGYDRARRRNHLIQQDLIGHAAEGLFSHLILGQDDAQKEGPQIQERRALEEAVRRTGAGQRVFFCEGIDQHANMLLSRAILDEQGWRPRIRIQLSDPLGEFVIPAYETSPVGRSLREQIFASGAIAVGDGDEFDYTLYVNTPNPRPASFNAFIQNLGTEIEQGFPVAVADINLGKTGTADPALYEALSEKGRAMSLLSFAGWNTAGNTVGTSIPAANVFLAARREPGVDPLRREVAQRTFLLHRLVNDFEYHRFTRPAAYGVLDRMSASRDEAYGDQIEAANAFVSTDLRQRLESKFSRQFAGQRFFAGPRQYELESLTGVDVRLPWPRAYEVKLDFSIRAREVVVGQ